MDIKTIDVSYRFKIKYEDEEHLKCIIADLKKQPMTSMVGAGISKDGRAKGYSCKRIGVGKILTKK